MTNGKWSLIAATVLSVSLLGSLTEGFVTTGPQSSPSSQSGSSLSLVTTDNEVTREPIGTPANEDNDDDDNDDDEKEEEEGDDEVDAFSSMMGMQAAASPGGQTVYVIEFESEAEKAAAGGNGHRNRDGKDMSDDGADAQSPLDPWSIVWYIGSFGGLIAFFLIVSCSEWCCRRGARSPLNMPYTQRGEVLNATAVAAAGNNQTVVTESPPPPYHLFAPPPYDSINYAEIADKGPAGEKLDIYVISLPIQAAPAQPPPA
ncbi:uncharacterized protein LOC131668071 [Phymastichus coffea]|uniref:uncharacterized protein LOC131668071 n=1 Tax=Phymastichus coffea TaxID=108790 RepID=UPI00273BAB68|nr:uncharacterized protein LOC131668071 [Phymastichus coffea]